MRSNQPTPLPHKALVRDMYNARAPSYDETVFHPALARLLFSRTQLKSGDAVLDLCTGTGIVALEAARAVGPQGRVVAVDFANDMLDVAKAKAAAEGVTNVRFFVDLGENEFDVVFCSAAAVWLDSLPADLVRWRKALKIGGIVAFNGWSEDSFVGGAILRHVALPRGIAIRNWHKLTATPELCKLLLVNAGLQVVAVDISDMSRVADPSKLKDGVDDLLKMPSGQADNPTLGGLCTDSQIADLKNAYLERVDVLTTTENVVPDEILTYSIFGRRVT